MKSTLDCHKNYLKLTQKDSLRVELLNIYTLLNIYIFDIVYSDLCLILSNLRAVQSVSQSAKKIGREGQPLLEGLKHAMQYQKVSGGLRHCSVEQFDFPNTFEFDQSEGCQRFNYKV